MILSKRNIYNAALKMVAAQIIIQAQQKAEYFESREALFEQFLSSVFSEIDSMEPLPFQLIIDVRFQPFINDLLSQQTHHFTILLDDDHLANAELSASVNYALRLSSNSQVDQLPASVKTLLMPYHLFELYREQLPELAKKYHLIWVDVNQYADFTKLKPLGAEWFVGEFIEKPERVNQTKIPANKVSVLNLISTLNKPDVEIDEVSEVIMADNILSYKLLRIVNSPIFRGMTELQSIQEAIVRFGFANLKKWVLMLSLCNVSDKPIALVKLALIRAIMCAELAEAQPPLNPEIAYTAGLLSTLDAFIDSPIEVLLEETALSDDIKRAILFHEEKLGLLLKEVIAFQRGELNHQQNPQYLDSYIASAAKAREIFSVLGMS